jgi:hypothetical protein
MGTKRGIKRSRVYASASSSSSDASTPPSSPPLSLPPPASLVEGSSQGPLSLMRECGEPSKEFSVVALDSEDEDDDQNAPDTVWDEEIARKLFSDLNRDLLGLPGDGSVIIINDSEEEEVHEDNRVDADVVPSSLRVSPASPTSATDNDDAPNGVQDDSSGGGDEAATS